MLLLLTAAGWAQASDMLRRLPHTVGRRAWPVPKYPSDVTLLQDDPSSAMIQPRYWKISPYYVGQYTTSACSIGTATMLMNAFFAEYKGARLADPLPSQEQLLKLAGVQWWTDATKEGGDGVPFDNMTSLCMPAAIAGMKVPAALRLFHYNDSVPVDEFYRAFESELRLLRAPASVSSLTFLGINFDLCRVMNISAECGHWSAVGAYDPVSTAVPRVLVLDVYRFHLEPYWVPLPKLVDAIMRKYSPDTRGGYFVLTRALDTLDGRQPRW